MDENDAYHLALGRFIGEFAFVEELLFNRLLIESGISLEAGRAVFSGVRADQARDFINRIHEASGRIRDPRLIRAFDQFGIITRARNDILHYGFLTADDGAQPAYRIVTNRRVAHVERAKREMLISPQILEDMSDDLSLIGIIVAATGEKPAIRYHSAEAEQMLDSPWRYKPTSPPPRG